MLPVVVSYAYLMFSQPPACLHSWKVIDQVLHFDLCCIESIRFQSILRQIVSGCHDTCYMCNIVDACHITVQFFFFLNLSVDCRPTVGQLSADSRPTVGRQVFWGALLHNYRHFDIMTCCCDNSIVLWMDNFWNPLNCPENLACELAHCSCITGSNEKLTNVPWPLEQESIKPKAQQEQQRMIRENWCIRIKINRMKDIKVRKGWPDRVVF